MRTSTKILLSVALSALTGVAGARAMTVRDGCTASLGTLSHVSARVGGRPVAQIGCCDGQIRCSQFLATTIVVRPRSDHRS